MSEKTLRDYAKVVDRLPWVSDAAFDSMGDLQILGFRSDRSRVTIPRALLTVLVAEKVVDMYVSEGGQKLFFVRREQKNTTKSILRHHEWSESL